MGAWIETPSQQIVIMFIRSHPTWVRGLKHVLEYHRNMKKVSHPTWVRGLKHIIVCHCNCLILSHPTWVRGLKQPPKDFEAAGGSVAPYVGAWIETIPVIQVRGKNVVAPYVGAWIETNFRCPDPRSYTSHPTWVRGLKLPICSVSISNQGRTLRGCVD